jgi:hypothetical protein
LGRRLSPFTRTWWSSIALGSAVRTRNAQSGPAGGRPTATPERC